MENVRSREHDGHESAVAGAGCLAWTQQGWALQADGSLATSSGGAGPASISWTRAIILCFWIWIRVMVAAARETPHDSGLGLGDTFVIPLARQTPPSAGLIMPWALPWLCVFQGPGLGALRAEEGWVSGPWRAGLRPCPRVWPGHAASSTGPCHTATMAQPVAARRIGGELAAGGGRTRVGGRVWRWAPVAGQPPRTSSTGSSTGTTTTMRRRTTTRSRRAPPLWAGAATSSCRGVSSSMVRRRRRAVGAR